MKKFIKVFLLSFVAFTIIITTTFATLFFTTDLFLDALIGQNLVQNPNYNNISVVLPSSTEKYEYYEYEIYINSESLALGLRTVNNSLLPWHLKLVNRYNAISENFESRLIHIGNGHYIDYRAAGSFFDMMQDAAYIGLAPIVISSYRSIARQRVLFENQVQRNIDNGLSFDEAFEVARRVVAYPGTSEHNLGLALDIVSYSYRGLTANFGQTPEGIWLAQNSHRYGFILRYAYDKQHITNIIYEPWHFRYVGVGHATAIFEQNLALEEYIALLFNQVNH